MFSNGEPKVVYPMHESHEWSMTLSLVRPHDRVVVIGAGEGLVQTAACIAARSPRNVIGYEAQGEVARRARQVKVNEVKLQINHAAVLPHATPEANLKLGDD